MMDIYKYAQFEESWQIKYMQFEALKLVNTVQLLQ